MLDADYTMLDAHNGRLRLYRFDSSIEWNLGFGETLTGYDTDVLCVLLAWGSVPAEEALLRVEQFAIWWNSHDETWWNSHDVSGMIESGSIRELRDVLRPFRIAGVRAEIVGLRWELG